MGEIRTLVDAKSIKYTGLFSLKGLFRASRDYLDERDYDPYEEMHSEEIFEEGKQILITIKGERKLSDYALIQWETKYAFTGCKETLIEKEDQKVKMHKGNVNIETSVYLVTDYDKSFEQNAFQYFLRVMIDKFVFKSYISKAGKKAEKDYAGFETLIKKYLNMESFR